MLSRTTPGGNPGTLGLALSVLVMPSLLAFFLLTLPSWVPTTAPGAAGEPKEQKENDSATIWDPGVLEPEGEQSLSNTTFHFMGKKLRFRP